MGRVSLFFRNIGNIGCALHLIRGVLYVESAMIICNALLFDRIVTASEAVAMVLLMLRVPLRDDVCSEEVVINK